MRWAIENDCLLCCHTKHTSFENEKIAAFDLDSTIIKTKSGKKFPQDNNDWMFCYESVKKKLKELHDDNYVILFITNQSGLKKSSEKKIEWVTKVENIMSQLEIPISVLACYGNNKFRKPLPGLWDYIEGDKKRSFYCGDAAGRPKTGKRKKDFSDSDLKFSQNIGIKFILPEKLFLDKDEEIPELVKTKQLSFTNRKININSLFKKWEITKKQCMILMCGYPGCGKSYLSKLICASKKNFRIVNRDALKTIPKCIYKCDEYLVDDYSVIVDNTNRDKDIRDKFIEVSKEHAIPIYCIVFNCTFDQSFHNSIYRHLTNPNINIIPKIAYYTYRKKYEEPDIEEGFEKIIKYTPSIYKKDINEEVYNMHLDV